MGNIILRFLAFFIAIELIVLVSSRTSKKAVEVLSEVTTATETPIFTETVSPSPVPTPTKTSTPTPRPTQTKTPTPVPQPTFSSQQINEFVDRFASQYSVDPHILRFIAICESGFNPKATNLSYAGLYQFSPLTWKNIRNQMGEDANADLRLNAEEAVQTAAYVLSKNKAYIWPNCLPKN